MAGTFPTPSQSHQRRLRYQQVKISCYPTNGNERWKSGRNY